MPKYSKYVIVVDNVSSITTAKDLEREFDFCGPIVEVVKDDKARVALIDFKRSSDAKYAWEKMDGFKMDGRRWKVDYANRADFKFFAWKWTEDTPSPSPPRGRSRSRSPAGNDPDTPSGKHGNDRNRSVSPAR
jgi:arginine/serine-rich splicing factor 2